MASLGDIVIKLSMNTSQFSGSAASARGHLAQIQTATIAVSATLAAAAAAAVGYGLKLAADAEQTAVSFEVMLGSAERARDMLGQLKAYADKSPFSGADTNNFAKMLLNYGVSGEKILPTIRMLGDVAAGDKEKFEGLARAFGQMSSTGRLMGQDLNQFINAGFNPLQEIAAKTGESMAALKKRMEDGGIASDEVAQAFVRATSEGGRFYGMTERQSRTLAGQWSTFRDNLDTTLRDIGASVAEHLDLKGVLSSTGQWLGFAGALVKKYGKELVSLVSIIASLVTGVAVARGAMLAYSAVQSILILKQTVLQALMGPTAWAQVAVGLAAAAATGLYLSRVFQQAHDEAAKTAAAIGEIKTKTDELSGAANAAKTATEKLMDLQIRMQQLQKVKTHSPQLATKLAQREFNSADVGKILELDGVGSAADRANPRVTLLRDTLASLNTMQGLIPAEQITQLSDRINAAIVREIDDRSGVTAAIAKQTEELKRLELGEEAYQAARMKEAGASANALAQLAAVQTQVDATKMLKAAEEDLAKLRAGSDNQFQINKLAAAGTDQATLDKIAETQQLAQAIRDQQSAEEQLAARAKQIQESTLTDFEKQKKRIQEIEDLKARGLIDEKTANRALEKIADENRSGTVKAKAPEKTAAAAMVGTSDAISIMLKGAFGNPNSAAQKTRQEMLAELKDIAESNRTRKKDAYKERKKSVLNI